ncbi:40S ribosomal protein S4-A [Rhypophila sp. PSN 637]
MATIEPRLIHLLNNSQTPHLPPIDRLPPLNTATSGQSFSLPPIDRENAPVHIPPLYTVGDDGHSAPAPRVDNNFSNDSVAGRLTGSGRPLQLLLGEPEGAVSTLPLRMLVDANPESPDDSSTKKRHRALTTKDEFVQLPQPLKKQKSNQQVVGVPPIINGLVEPPPNAQVFPPITSEPFGNRDMPGTALLKDFGNNQEDRAGTAPTSDADKSNGSAKVKRRAAKPRRKWSEEETNHLLLGVNRHGVGKWTSILEDPEYKFNERTAGDLKDRFRTCCPDELRGNTAKKRHENDGEKTGQDIPDQRWRHKNGPNLEHILTDTERTVDREPDVSESAPKQPKKSRAHRKKIEDLRELGIHAPFKKSHRRERRPFTEQDDKEILEGLNHYGPAWTKIQRDSKYNLSSRQPTDLRDRVRNKYPEIYAKIEKGSFQVKDGAHRGGTSLLEPSISTTMTSSFSSTIPAGTSSAIEQSLTRKKHQKRLSAPSHWLLDKLSGVYAPRPSAGPHKLRECMPLIVFVRNRLKYALNYRETKSILMQRLIKVDGKVRTDMTYPAGFMDVISIEKTGENFRLIYDTKGRFTVHRIKDEEAKYKLGKVKRVQLGRGGIPFLVTHDARTIRYPDPLIKVNDTVKIDLETGKITDFIKFDTGSIAMITGGRNMGRVGVITHRERHDGGFNIVHLKDAIDNSFATRESNVFVIGSEKPWISLPKGKGVKLTIAEERDRRRANQIAH